jgi:outer membrane receptor protein involved in Fe transport
LWGKQGYSTLTLYTNGTTSDVNVRETFSRRVRGAQGEVLSYEILNTRPIFTNYSYESFVGGKFDLFYVPHPQHELSVGVQLQTARKWKNDVFLEGDTLRFDLDRNGIFETGTVVIPQMSFHQEIGLGDASKYYLYVNDKYAITPRLSLTVGLRYDRFTYSGFGSFSPRGSLSYQLVPGITTITFATGRYYQTQPFPYYSDRRNIGYNKTLNNMEADHYVLGFEHILDVGLKMSVEAYYKKYGAVAVQEDFVYSAIDTYWSDRYLAIGQRSSYGLEFFFDQKQVTDYFGTVSISLSRSRMKDPRIPKVVDTFPSDYDYPVIVTLLGGKVVKGIRSWLNEAPLFVKYPLYILPLSDEMEISLRYRFQTGRPYTPLEYVSWKQVREGGVKWSKGAWVESSDHNGVRYRDYSRLDLQWISRFYFRNWNINAYVALQNVLNTKNIFFENHRSDGTVETIYQFSFFPVAGVEVEF